VKSEFFKDLNVHREPFMDGDSDHPRGADQVFKLHDGKALMAGKFLQENFKKGKGRVVHSLVMDHDPAMTAQQGAKMTVEDTNRPFFL
jgi:hypothetical protein